MEEGGGGKKSLEWQLGLNIGVERHNADVLKKQGEVKEHGGECLCDKGTLCAACEI
jgi:hypothetical protein